MSNLPAIIHQNSTILLTSCYLCTQHQNQQTMKPPAFSLSIHHTIFYLAIGIMTLGFPFYLNSQLPASSVGGNYPIDQYTWVEEQINTLTPDERLGQLFMVAAYSNRDEGHKAEIAQLIQQYHIGGLIFMQDNAEKQAALTNYFQSIAKTPLLIAIDGEWGLQMRLKDTPRFPKQLTLGAVQDNRLIYEMGKEIARQCQRLGIHINFAPVVDVNVNPSNPVINDRSFGEDKYNVAAKGIEYARGLETNGVLACAKHFPGHGDTDQDSHHTLPLVPHDLSRLHNIELYPFQQLSQFGIASMMVAHLAVPALDNNPVTLNSSQTMPTTLSKNVITQLLRQQIGYNGLVFTDALNMKGVSSFFAPGVVDAQALVAGNDVLLFSENVGQAIVEIKKAIARGDISQAEIDERVRKILKAKYRVGLASTPKKTIAPNVLPDLNQPSAELIKRKLYEAALTLAKNDQNVVPITTLNKKTIASVAIGATTLTSFQQTLGKYARVEHHTLRYTDTEARFQQKLSEVKDNNIVIVSLHNMSPKASGNWGISSQAVKFIKNLQKSNAQVILVVFGNPYSLKNFDDSQTVLVSYEENSITQSLSAQLLFGAVGARGKLPVTASPSYNYGQGYLTSNGLRLQYGIPEELGISYANLQPIDNIVNDAIQAQALPGCQVLVAKNNKVIFQKSYGYHTYSHNIPVADEDLYDVASLTKILAAAPALMRMYESGSLNLYGRLGDYLPQLQGTNKADLTIRDILIHESGLDAWIPFYEATLTPNIRNEVYHNSRDNTYSVEVADNMYMNKDYIKDIYRTIDNSSLKYRGEYKYSDLGYYYFKDMIEQYAHEPLDQYLDQTLYQPMGLASIRYRPLDCFSRRSITPTENDKKWRKQVVHGYVHDMGAAMLGGVCAHAGLFSNANDVAAIMQMYLNGGNYGGNSYFNQSTVALFTSQQKEGNRRGLAFDKPEPNANYKPTTSRMASPQSFGHTGFTGTCTWADPQKNLVYVFLSNRVYPSSDNNKINARDVRNRIQDVIYQAVASAQQPAYSQ